MGTEVDENGVIKVKVAFKFGDMVFLRANPDYVGCIVRLELFPGFAVKYGVKWPSCLDFHYEFELEKSIIQPD